MKKQAWRYGLFATLVIVGIPLIGFLIGGPVDMENASMGEVIGYGSIIVGLSVFIFLGIRKYRDELNEGNLSFMEAMKLGLLIAAIPAVGFALYNVIYAEWMDPAFMDNYFNYQLELLEAKLSPEDYKVQAAAMQDQKEMFANPVLNFVVMFFTVFIIGVIVTVLTSFILKSKTPVSTTA